MRAFSLAAPVLAASVALAGCGQPSKPSPPRAAPSPPRLTFADPTTPLHYVDRGVVAHRDGVAIHDVSFSSGGLRVDGYLVAQPGAKRRPAIVVVHGSGGDRSELLGRAVELAARGNVVLTITEPSTAHPPHPANKPTALLSAFAAVQVHDVVAARRAADALIALPIVDPHELGYLGWSAGAKTGAFVAASDPRFKGLALLSAGADKLSAFIASAPPGLRTAVRRELGSVDPLRYASFARPGTVLLEDGRQDEIVPRRALLNMVHAAPRGTPVHWYPTKHALDTAAYRDAYAWLATKLQQKHA